MNRKQRRATAGVRSLEQDFAAAVRLHQAGNLGDAARGYEAIVRAAPQHVGALSLLGSLTLQRGDAARAIALLARAVALQPDLVDAQGMLGAALEQQGRWLEAAACFRAALVQRPELTLAHLSLGRVLRADGQLDDAVTSFRRALARDPSLVWAHSNLGLALMQRGDHDEAIAAQRQAVALVPDVADLHGNLGLALHAAGRLVEAAESHRRAASLAPTDAAAWANLAGVLLDLGRLDEARASFARALALKPDYPEVRSNLLLLANYDPTIDDAGLLEAHREYDRRVTAPLRPAGLAHANDRAPERRLRIGYVSGDFRRHPVGYFFLPALGAHDPAAVEAFCYSGLVREDDLTREIRERAHHWRPMVGVGDNELATQIRADGIDILVDLAGHTGGNRLPVFGRKPAPVQVAWLGYFNTTGVGAIDYALMDAATVPEGAERWFTERVVRLPEGRFCYAPPDYAPAVAPLPALSRGDVTFGSFNNISKVTPAVIQLWSAVLAAVPGSRLIVKWKVLADAAEGARLRQAFGAHAIAPERLELRGSTPHPQMLGEYGDVDIGLDPFPFCGGLTSCEALWMGVPIVTLAGSRPASRQTLGFLNQIGLGELAAADPQRYVALAAELAGDRERLAALRAGLRARMAASSLCDASGFARRLEDAYRTMWRAWCARATT